MRIRRITISATFAAGLATLPLSTAKAQYHPHQQQPTAQSTANQLNREEFARHQSGNGYPPYYWASGSPGGWRLSMGMGVGLSGLLLAVPTVLAVLRGGRGRRHRRDDRHRPGPGADGGAALLLRAGILRAAVLLRATLSPPATRCPPRPATAPPQLRSWPSVTDTKVAISSPARGRICGKSGSHQTLPWRKVDSNPRSP
jgi:hypothetical protein